MRILVVDDDPAILDSMKIVLELGGHSVAGANGGLAGLVAFEAALNAGEPFGIVITDLTMAGLNGDELAGAVKRLSPSTPVVLATGWGERRATARVDEPAIIDFVLRKPPTLSDLRAVITACTKAIAAA